MSSTTVSGTKSGIITSTDGERHIPASVRPDGSTRKEIKIRPGYRPPEDVEVYKNQTAEAWKNRGVGARVPGSVVIDHEDVKPSSNKNAKRREARKRAKAAGEDSQDVVKGLESAPDNEYASQQSNGASTSIGLDSDSWRKEEKDIEPALDLEAEKEKQARSLKKKLRQARELREKKDKGGNLLPEQFAKVIKINELIRQLDSLGFDQEGEPKQS
ncbi:MAG: hypothetical protein L6R41_004229 [Letrouitia leprolyta]|nr:MAG: hypothetical protein L6R41_004229 [Letrouitia leprolyta]